MEVKTLEALQGRTLQWVFQETPLYIVKPQRVGLYVRANVTQGRDEQEHDPLFLDALCLRLLPLVENEISFGEADSLHIRWDKDDTKPYMRVCKRCPFICVQSHRLCQEGKGTVRGLTIDIDLFPLNKIWTSRLQEPSQEAVQRYRTNTTLSIWNGKL